MASGEEFSIAAFLQGKSEHTIELFNHFVNQYQKLGEVTVVPLKTMIGIDNGHKRIAYITHLGKNFIHIVFPFKQGYFDNMCFQKILQVPGQAQYNHHFRMLTTEDVNEEVMYFMKLAYQGGQ